MAASKGFPQSRPLASSTPLRPKRDSPRRKSRGVTHGMLWSDVRLVIYTRALGRCEVCGAQLNIANMEAHHRRTRRLGPDCPGNGLCLCRSCHHDGVHGQPELAKEKGWIASRFTDEPCAQPVWIQGRGWVTLSCGGEYVSTTC